MKDPFNFEAEPFELDTEFDEYEEEQADAYSEFDEEYESDYEAEPFETYTEFDGELETFDTELDDEVWQGDVDRSSSNYVHQAQSSRFPTRRDAEVLFETKLDKKLDCSGVPTHCPYM